MEIKCCVSKCNKSFNSVNIYRTHLRIIHSFNKQYNDYYCTYESCRTSFKDTIGLLKHLSSQHKFPKDVENVLEKQPENIVNSDETSLDNHAEIYHVSQDYNEENPSEKTILEALEENDLKTTLNSMFFNFLNKLHQKPSLSKSIIKDIYAIVKNEIIEPLCMIMKYDENIKKTINNAYSKFDSQYKLEKYMNDNLLFTKGENIIINFKTDTVFQNGSPILGQIKDKICIMPISNMFASIFAQGNILEDTLNLMNNRIENNFSNIADGERWKLVKEKYSNDTILIPFEVYFDDFEPDNALGSNSGTNKIAAYYARFPTMPSHLLSSTEYVFEIMMHPSNLKSNEFSACLEEIVNRFQKLEEGIDIMVNEKVKKVRFILMRILGDNLGLNEILGFSRGFNSIKFCRFCTISRQDSMKSVKLLTNGSRNKNDYENDLEINDQKKTGIREKCCFNELKNFHCTENFSCDIMHDIYEGIVKKDVSKCLNKLIDDKFISLETLNLLKQHFDYNELQLGHSSKPILKSHLDQESLKMSASESKCFLELLPIMIGHLIPPNNLYYKLILTLVDISDNVMRTSFNEEILIKLRGSIQSYLKQYVKLFGETLRPKHHFMLHYEECIRKNGPLRHMMTFVFETKNREVKTYSKVSYQRVNLSFSLCYKAAMRFNSFIEKHQKGFPEETVCSKQIEIGYDDLQQSHYFNALEHDLVEFDPKQSIFRCKYLKHKNTTYKNGYFFLKNLEHRTECFKIIDQLVWNGKYLIIAEIFTIKTYKKHLRCYELGDSKKNFMLINVENLTGLPFLMHKVNGYNFYFRIPHI